jgi:hypothetical protein
MAAAKQIKVTCDVEDALPLDSITEFQGNFKRHDQYDIKNIIKSLIKYGINFPFFIWQDQDVNYCLDGHGRRIALVQLREQAYQIPDIPIIHIYAKDREEAVQKMLRLNSRYGAITDDSVLNFIGEISIELSEIAIPDFNNIEFANLIKTPDNIFSTETPRKEKPVKRCPYCGGILK